jgi:hypothetical protein
MSDQNEGMLAFLGVPADRRLLDEDLVNLPAAEQYHEPAVVTHKHDRLVAAGSLLTGTTLIGGGALMLYGGWEAIFNGGGALDLLVAVVGILLVATHWGWVHVAEYLGVTIDERANRTQDARRQEWLEAIQPYPRFSVSTVVLDDASTRIERVLHRPVLTAHNAFTFVRETEAEKTYDADAPAEVIASSVEEMRRQARIETDRTRGLWEAASSAYAATLSSTDDDKQRLAAQRAAAVALSEHINKSLLEPPLVE